MGHFCCAIEKRWKSVDLSLVYTPLRVRSLAQLERKSVYANMWVRVVWCHRHSHIYECVCVCVGGGHICGTSFVCECVGGGGLRNRLNSHVHVRATT